MLVNYHPIILGYRESVLTCRNVFTFCTCNLATGLGNFSGQKWLWCTHGRDFFHQGTKQLMNKHVSDSSCGQKVGPSAGVKASVDRMSTCSKNFTKPNWILIPESTSVSHSGQTSPSHPDASTTLSVRLFIPIMPLVSSSTFTHCTYGN